MTAAADDPRDRLLAEENIRLAARNRMLHAALSRTLSALTAYGGHHDWCDWKADHKSPCNCGFDGEVIVARESLDTAPPPQPEADSPALGAEWRAVETALPEGWVVDGLRRLYDNGHDGRRFVARAVRPTPIGERDDGWVLPLRFGIGPTPTAALRALAEKLLTDDAARGGERP